VRIADDEHIYMSARSPEARNALLDLIERKLAGGYQDCNLLLPYKRGDIVSYLTDNAVVHTCTYHEDGIHLHATLRNQDAGRYKEYIIHN